MLKLPFGKYPVFGKDDPEYAYACGRVKALETRLLDKVRFERLATAKDFEDLLKLLQDTDYSKYLNEVHSPADYEIILRRELEKLFTLVSELSVDKTLERDLRITYDFLNIKILVKSVIFEADFSPYYTRYSYYPISVIRFCIESGKLEHVEPFLIKAYEEAIASYYEKKEIYRIDTAVDRVMYEYLTSKTAFEYLRILFNIKADLNNLLTFLRLERLNRLESYGNFSLPGGYLPREVFSKVSDFQTLLHEIRHTVYYDVITPGYQYYLKTGSYVRLERDIASYINGFIRLGGAKDLGVEPLIAYYFKKRNEVGLLRMIMVSKLNDLPKEQILERIPEEV